MLVAANTAARVVRPRRPGAAARPPPPPPGADGRDLRTGGPHRFARHVGYLGSPEATAESLENAERVPAHGRTSGTSDDEGFVHVEDRIKEMVKTKGTQVAPAELEGLLLQYVRDKKVRYKWLVEIEFADSIPKSPTGKLLRRVLKTAGKDRARKRGLSVHGDARRARL